MNYSTSPDEIVRKKTIGVFILFAVLPLYCLILSSHQWIWFVSFFAFFMLVLLFTYLHKPLKYQVDSDKIVIHRHIGNVQINIQDIVSIHRVHHDLLKNVSRGGAFGYFGKLNTDLGQTTFYATRRNKCALITKSDKTKIILTPDQYDEFVEDVERKVSCQQAAWQIAG